MQAFAKVDSSVHYAHAAPDAYNAITDIDTFDYMKFVLEQTIYATYLNRMTNSNRIPTPTVQILYDTITKHRRNLKPNLPLNMSALQSLYSEGIAIIDSLLSRFSYTSRCPIDANPASMYAIFNTPQKSGVSLDSTIAKSTIDQTFLDLFVYMEFGWARESLNEFKNEEGIIERDGFPIYIPDTQFCSLLDNITDHDNREHIIRITLCPKIWGTFRYKYQPIDLLSMLECYYAPDKRFDDLVAILASFSIDHDRYVMTNSANAISGGTVLADICYDMVTGSSYCTKDLPRATIGAFLARLFKSGCIGTSVNTQLFGELLEIAQEDESIRNYFLKPVSQITSAEAYEFKHSIYSTMFSDRVLLAMEAADEEVPEEEPEEDADEGDGDEQPDDMDMGDEETSFEEDTESDDDSSANVDDKPQIDPQAMLLELNQQDHTLSDYLFRQVVETRISAILKNPPINASPNDLLALKRWKSRWLYLVSMACLRDFLTRVSLRISNN